MKLLSLEIKQVRGIKDLSLGLDGKNIVISGINGSGKSGVVDALDFLFTGQMGRLIGTGTQGISLKKHGKHIDCDDLAQCLVSATVMVKGIKEQLRLVRRFNDSSTLEVSPEQFTDQVNKLLHAIKGQHLLTRRDILRFVAADKNDRAQQIQNLLNLNEIESTRTVLVKAKNVYENIKQAANRDLQEAARQIVATTEIPTPLPRTLLAFINKNRAILRGQPFLQLQYLDLKKDLSRPADYSANSLNPKLSAIDFAEVIKQADRIVTEDLSVLSASVNNPLTKIKSDPLILKNLKTRRLVELGLELADDDALLCPLCDSHWTSGELIPYLTSKQEKAEAADILANEVNVAVDRIKALAEPLKAALAKANSIAIKIESFAESKKLRTWLDRIEELDDLLSMITDTYTLPEGVELSLAKYLEEAQLAVTLKSIQDKVVSASPSATAEGTAWELLIRLEENFIPYNRAKRRFQIARKNSAFATTINDHFSQAREMVLGDLYKVVGETFVTLYRELHGDHEDRFGANLEPTLAGIKFDVDFHGRGQFPPLALHSEGHQDSMGVCLFLALSDRLNKGVFDLVMLDDVVMSVDVEHRQKLCEVLRDNFGDRQFIITTHDKVWAEMLRTATIVNRKGLKEFFNWSIDAGPNIFESQDIWSRIDEYLQKGDVSGASGQLRRGGEEFFHSVCERLDCTIKFRSGGRWDFGHYYPAALSGLKDALKKARASATSWENEVRKQEIEQFEQLLNEAVQNSDVERWVINPTVHFTEWMNLQPRELGKVVESYQQLFSIFSCRAENGCGSPLYLTFANMKPDSLRCACNAINWSLIKKDDAG